MGVQAPWTGQHAMTGLSRLASQPNFADLGLVITGNWQLASRSYPLLLKLKQNSTHASDKFIRPILHGCSGLYLPSLSDPYTDPCTAYATDKWLMAGM